MRTRRRHGWKVASIASSLRLAVCVCVCVLQMQLTLQSVKILGEVHEQFALFPLVGGARPSGAFRKQIRKFSRRSSIHCSFEKVPSHHQARSGYQLTCCVCVTLIVSQKMYNLNRNSRCRSISDSARKIVNNS